ncbi:hypothetical protein H8E65_00640 [Candidatus Bathyarchaeota archaeon]|nr:hypothetical protein [Candidatus Bathyarchaeota archaeon]
MAYITLYPLGFPIPISDQTRYVYAAVDVLETGDIFFVNMGYESGTIAFMEPGMVAVFRHAISKGVKLVIMSTAVESPMLVGRLMDKVKPEASGYVYGEDWVHLGFIAGGEPSYASLMGDINGLVTEDYQQTPTSDLPLMAELGAPTHEKIALVGIWTAGGDVIEGWIRQAAVQYDLPLITEVNEMMVPTLLPYYPINLDGILNGGIGAAEYENLSGFAGEAIKLSDMMTMGGLVVLIFLILGNIGFLMTKGGKK